MARAIFTVVFDRSLPTYPGTTGASRVGQVPQDGVPTNLVWIEAPATVIAAMKVDPDYFWVEDLDG